MASEMYSQACTISAVNWGPIYLIAEAANSRGDQDKRKVQLREVHVAGPPCQKGLHTQKPINAENPPGRVR